MIIKRKVMEINEGYREWKEEVDHETFVARVCAEHNHEVEIEEEKEVE